MLVLSREVNERLMIGDDIVITVVKIDCRGRVRLGIEAPAGVTVDREEVRANRNTDNGGTKQTP